jgi:hypothetical protein
MMWLARFRTVCARWTRPVSACATIDRPPAEVYACYRQLLDQLTCHVAACDGHPIDLEIVEQRVAAVLAWRSSSGAGRVTFTPAHRSGATAVEIELAARFGTRRAAARRLRRDLEELSRIALELPPARRALAGSAEPARPTGPVARPAIGR